MKSLLARWRVFIKLKIAKPRPASGSSCPEEISKLLAQTAPPEPEFPPGLHDSIVRTVRLDSRPPGQTSAYRLRWLLRPAFAVAVILGVLAIAWHSYRSPVARQDEQTLAVMSASLQNANQTASAMPAIMAKPLSEELQRVRSDLTNTTEFLFA